MKKRTIYLMVIPLCALLLVAGGGWWANQAGLLGQWGAPVAQTASAVAGGVQAQPGQSGTLTTTLPSGGPGSNGFAAPPDGMTPPDGSPPAANDQASGQAAGTAAATPTAGAAATGQVASIPAVAGVQGGSLYGEDGALLATLESGASVLVTGRSADNGWLSVSSESGDGWIEARQLIVYGLHRLAVAGAPAAVLAVPAEPAATSTPAAATAVAGTAAGITTSATLTEAAGDGSAGAATTVNVVPTAALTARVNTDQGRLNIRSGPGTDYAVVAKAENGATYTVVGRSDAGDWLQLQWDDGETGWAAAVYLAVDGDVSRLPVRLAPAAAAQAASSAPQATAANGATPDSSTPPASIIDVANYDASATGDLQGTIVFQQSPGGMIYAYDLQTGKLWQLTNGFDPAVSPDGSTVAFVRDGGEMGLYLINIDGSNERRIFERAVLSSPKWSPDGQWIVFSRNDEGVECYQMMPNYCMLPEEAKHRFPMGIPDTIPLVTEYQHKLSMVDSSGNNFHDVAALNSARAVDWSDAGIVYQSTAGIQITSDSEDAANREVIFDNLNPYYFDPDLQPGGGQIVFQIKGAAQTELWVVNTDGTGKTALTHPATTLVTTLPSNVAPAYSPDGRHIVFLSNRSADNNAGDWHLWVMNADGSDQRQLPIELAIDYTYGLDQVVSWGA